MLLERPSVTPEEAKQRQRDINRLASDFITHAKPIVQRIVEELDLPVNKKSIQPAMVGGVAGGEKFMTDQLFIKFAKDDIQLKLYNGDEWAQKAAMHEVCCQFQHKVLTFS